MGRTTLAVFVGALGCWTGCAQAAEDAAPAACANETVREAARAFVDSGAADGLSTAVVKDGKTTFCDVGTIERDKVRVPTPDTVYESYINAWGYRLLHDKRVKDAVNLFAYNVAQHPQSGNPYDSLAEAYEALGDTENAIANYRLSLARNADNEHAKSRLAALAKPGG